MKLDDIALSVLFHGPEIEIRPFDFGSWKEVEEDFLKQISLIPERERANELTNALNNKDLTGAWDVSGGAAFTETILKYLPDYFGYFKKAYDMENDIEPFLQYLSLFYQGKSPAETYDDYQDSYLGRYDSDSDYFEERYFRDCFNTPKEVMQFIDWIEVRRYFASTFVFVNSVYDVDGFMFNKQ